jgi:hypothetical protein
MQRAIEELRSRRDFVVVYKVGSHGAKRTPAMALLEAWDWYRIVTGQDPQGRYELTTACRSVLSQALMQAEGSALPN